MKQHKRLAMTLLGLTAAGGAALAGEEVPAPPPPPAADSGGCDWCKCLTDKFGEPIYQNDDAMLIQAVKFFGRAQFQFAYIDGEDADGSDFSESFEEIRRLRFGTDIQALKYFRIKANANFADDKTPEGGDRDIGYDSLDVATVSFDAGRLLGGSSPFDSLKLNYGRHKVTMGQEVHTSSNKIKTVERSAVANKIYPKRMTGGTIDANMGNVSASVGVFSTDSSKEIADWSQGEAYYAGVSLERDNGDEVLLDFLYNDAAGSSENQVSDNVGMSLYEWALSLAYVAKRGNWEFMVNGTIGDNGSDVDDQDGTFWGIVVMPSYWLIADKLEAVVRYAYQGADEAQGISANKRYVQLAHDDDVNVGDGLGDEHHSIYAGLNYFFCGHNAKLMAGGEWETIDTHYGDVDAWTWWLAWRMYF